MTVILDKNVFTQIARGNSAASEALKRLLATHEPVYIATSAYNELVRDSPVRFRMGYEMLLKNSNITKAPSSSLTDRATFYADNPGPGEVGRIKEYGNGASKEKPGDAFVAAEAKALNARLWTFDKDFAKRASALGVTIAQESQIAYKSGEEDIGQARRLMGLRPLSMMQSTVARQAASTSQTKGGKTTASSTGSPIEPVQEHGPSASGDAKFQVATQLIQVVDFGLQKINGIIQSGRYEREWTTRWQPEVQRRLDADPQLGALVLISYAKDAENPDSGISPVAVFQSIQVGYGLNVDDALRDLELKSRIVPGRADVGQRVWIKPKGKTDIARLKLPFDTTIASLATFVPGKEKLVRVMFSGRAGFDDKMFSKEELDVPSGMTPRFFVLWPPDKVQYFLNGWVTTDIDWELSYDADISHGDIDPVLQGVPVVKLDSGINPYNATAAMVWPADNNTANLFQKARATQDNLGLLASKGIGPMRWVRPEFIRVLKAPYNAGG